MKILIVLPDHNYFLWQMLVQINNFRKIGIVEEDVIYLIGKNNHLSPTLKNIIDNGKLKCSFFIFDDKRIDSIYPVSLRPFLIKEFFQKYPEMEKETYFYTDPDVIFTKKLDFTSMINDNIWYLSDTRSYLDSNYIKSKSPILFDEMCNIVGVSPEIVIENDNKAGGAQYLLKNTNVEFWDKVEKDCEKLYKHMINTSNKYKPEHPIQAWTADMWSTLWNAWYFGHETKIDKELEFCWATDSIDKWSNTNIFHNAGVTSDDKKLFSKISHQISPFRKDLICDKGYCVSNYVDEIKDTEKNMIDIIF
jgi:hypothetical protein